MPSLVFACGLHCLSVAWAVSQHTDTSKNTKAWAVSQHTDTSKNTEATPKCCYSLYSYVGAIFSCDKLLASQHPFSRNGEKSSEDGI